MILRKITEKLLAAATQMPVVTITGPRQSGKTTLSKAAFPAHRYLSLEDIELRQFAKKDPKGFLAQHRPPLILDEVQYAPELISYIQLAVDDDPAAGQFILTGSQNLLLMEQVSQSLAGRAAIFHLLPLSMEELWAAGRAVADYEPLLIKGFYPRIHDRDLVPSDWLRDYTATYVERDVRQLVNIENADVFQQFLSLCAGRVGQIVNFSEMGAILGVSFQTVRRWLSVLQTSFIAFTAQPFHRNFDKRITKMPKLYFYDTGLACSLLGIRTVEQLNTHFSKGGLFENFVINELRKNTLNRGERPGFYFWRQNEVHEVDLIIDLGTRLFAIEIKAGKTIQDDFFRGIRHFQAASGLPADDSFIIYGGSEQQNRSAATVLGWAKLAQPSGGGLLEK